ncbi:MAG: replication protein RepA [Bryobacteraceae bacterium]
MESCGTLLKRMVPELIVSKQRLRQTDGISLVRTNRDERKQVLAFSSRPFVMCGLPVRQPPKGQLLFERRNGSFVLQITGHPEFGLPFGQDRLVPIYLATLAIQQKSQTVRFRSGAEMLDTFGMSKGGKEYRRLVQAFERIFGATIFFGTDQMRGTAKVVQRSRFNFLQEARIWYSRDPNQSVLPGDFENAIVLSDEFYREVASHPIPTDLEAVKVLAGAPAVLDLFMWLSYRCHLSQREEGIPIFGSFGLAQQLGSIEYSRPRRFRVKLEQWLDTIRTLWPECPARIGADGTTLLIERASAVLDQRSAQ